MGRIEWVKKQARARAKTQPKQLFETDLDNSLVVGASFLNFQIPKFDGFSNSDFSGDVCFGRSWAQTRSFQLK